MKQPEQIYKVDHTAENVKIIEDYTAEKCLYSKILYQTR